MTPREHFISALLRQNRQGRPPHFELVFFLTMEAFGKVHPSHRSYHQWDQMEDREQIMHLNEMADLYIATAERYEHSAIFLHPNPGTEFETQRLIETVREKTGSRYFLMMHGDATFSIPDGTHMEHFAYRLADEPDAVKAEAQAMVDAALARAERQRERGGLDGYALCSDYCFNTGPFLSPRQFSEFITPYLARLVQGYRQLGFYVIKHTDGNINPIIDQLVQCGPHAIHSLDPQGGVDMAAIKMKYGREVCLIGNVNCGLLDSGTDQEVVDNTLYALRNGSPGGGYIFSTSNCIYTGMRLSRYHLMHNVWKNFDFTESATPL